LPGDDDGVVRLDVLLELRPARPLEMGLCLVVDEDESLRRPYWTSSWICVFQVVIVAVGFADPGVAVG
jgi:hypothetical protein